MLSRAVAPRSLARNRSERGTLAMAMIVLMVCAATAGLLVTRNVSTAHQAVEETNRGEALAAADAGLSQARAHLSVGEAPPRLSGTVGEAEWAAEITRTSVDTYALVARGSSGGSTRTVEATVRVDGRNVSIENWHQVSGSS